jgi:hypothetical protein
MYESGETAVIIIEERKSKERAYLVLLPAK